MTTQVQAGALILYHLTTPNGEYFHTGISPNLFPKFSDAGLVSAKKGGIEGVFNRAGGELTEEQKDMLRNLGFGCVPVNSSEQRRN